ncbi:MAG: helix-turn-helix transcriptional regulator [Planctomycetes bacterium]|nr:helix-turn-helix transcriptional regulator [Planctomycetota bacterium]
MTNHKAGLPAEFNISAITHHHGTAHKQKCHSHHFYELLCISEGETHVIIKGREYVAGPGDLLIYYPDEEHEETVQPGKFSYVWLRFPRNTATYDADFPTQEMAGPLIHLPWPERFQKIFHEMIVEYQSKDEWSEILIRAGMTSFFALLQRGLRCTDANNHLKDGQHERMGAALQLIHGALSENVPLSKLASKSFMSESHFSHTFKEVIGVSPKQYMIQARIARSQELLKTTEQSISEIAWTVGYENQHHFSRAFRKVAGISPTEFRNKSRK